jgi:methyl-accepting chemotaxis protein
LNIRQKILSLVIIMTTFMVIVGGIGYQLNKEANEDIEILYKERLLPVIALSKVETNLRQINALTLKIFTMEPAKRFVVISEIDKLIAEDDELLKQYEATKLDKYESDQLQGLQDRLKESRELRSKVIALVQSDRIKEATDLYFKDEYIIEEVIARSTDLVANHKKLAEEAHKLSQERAVAETTTIALTIGLAVIFSAGIGYMLALAIATPLRDAVGRIQEVSNGNLTVSLVKSKSVDEVGSLVAALNTMVVNLRMLVRNVSQSAESLASSSEQLMVGTEQSAQASNQVASSVSEVSQGSEKQVVKITDTFTVVEQMSQSIQNIAANANQATDLSLTANQAADNGTKVVNTVIAQMSSIEKSVSFSAEVVSKLGERSKDIGRIVETISGIAGQTNLLALNAAIEAARAGEQGRGFAVVAEEVRKLAEQSQEAAKEITSLVDEIQSDTENAVQAMNGGTQEVKVGADVVSNAGKTFQEISAIIRQVATQIQDISLAVQQVAGGSQQVVSSVKEIELVSKETANQTQIISAATEEQSASVQEIAASSQTLAKLAKELQNTIGSFKL